MEENCEVLLEGGSTSADDSDEDYADGSGSGSGQPGGSGSGSGDSKYCLLLRYLYDLAVQFEGEEVYQLWLDFIEELHYQIVLDGSLTVHEKLIAIWARLEAFVEVHAEIEVAVYYLYIEEWGGYVRNLEAVTVSFSASDCQSVVALDAEGSCQLVDALKNGTSGELNSLLESLESDILSILGDASYSYSYQLVLIYEKFAAFFAAHADYKADVLAVEIEGFGVVGSFVEVAAYYYRAYYIDSVVAGSDASDCVLLQTFTAAYQNSSAATSTERAQIKQFEEKLASYWSSETDAEARIEYFQEQLYQFMILQDWAVNVFYSWQMNITVDGEAQAYGDIYQFIYAFVLVSGDYSG